MKHLYVLVLLFILGSCNNKQAQKGDENTTSTEPTFEMVAVPSIITEPEQRADYLVKHYWDKFNFQDTSYIHYPKVTEQALSNYIDAMQHASPGVVEPAIKDMMKKAEADSAMFAFFANLYEKYLYEPNSPIRNEDLFIPVLEAEIASTIWDDVYKIRPTHLLELVKKNRVGHPASDFSYVLENGQKGTMYAVKAKYLLLYFFNPGCHACKEISEHLSNSPIIAELLRTKELKILAVYPDEDLTAFKEYLHTMPTDWIISYDKTVTLKNDEVYDLKAIPTLYLLDKDKKVLLKDITPQQLEESFIMDMM